METTVRQKPSQAETWKKENENTIKKGTIVRRKHCKNETIVTGKLFVGKQNRKERLSIKKII